jgi:hypothetical protein
MLTRIFRRILVSCAAVCVLLLFFFPLVHGPFQATHGPTTEFRALKAFLVLLFSILSVACAMLYRLNQARGFAHLASDRGHGFWTLSPTESTAILRC